MALKASEEDEGCIDDVLLQNGTSRTVLFTLNRF